jgi:signal transduction histidine kinase
MEPVVSGTTAPSVASRPPGRFALAAGVGLVALGGAVLAGWVLGVEVLVQVHPSLAPMQANAAVALVLCGLALLAHRWGRSGAGAALGLAVVLLGALTFGQYLFGLELGLDELLVDHYITTHTSHPGRMAPDSALALVMAGAALALFRRRPRISALLGALVIAVGAAWLLGYAMGLTGGLALSSYTQMAIQTAFGLGLLGAALLALSLAREAWPRVGSPWLPFVAGTVLALGTLVLWRALDLRASEHTGETVEVTARGAAREIEERVQTMIRSLEHLQEHGREARWRSTQDWQNHARLTLGAFQSFVTAHWTDASAERRTMAVDERWDSQASDSLLNHPRFLGALARASESDAPVVAGPFPHPAGPLFQVVLPPAEAGSGYLAAAFSAPQAIGRVVEAVAPGYRVAVMAEGKRVFLGGAEGSIHAAERWAVRLPLELPGGFDWRMSVAPGAALMAAQRNWLPEAVLLAGLIIAFLLTLTLRYGELAEARARDFEAMVRQRTDELEGALDRLRQENRERRRTETTLRRFMITLGHELRNPLGSVTTALEVLDRGLADEATAQRMRQILRRQLGHLSRLVDDLLDISRIEQDKVVLRTERLDAAALVREVAEAHRAQAEAAGLTLETELPAGPAWVEGDATRLVQVLENLVSNSLKFTDPGGRVRLVLEREQGEVAVRVRDTGCGLSPEELEQVFEPFAQTDEAQRRMSGGLGLGLPIVKGLIEAHGGRLEAASPGPGRGAEFTVRLPAASPPEEPAVAAAPRARRPERPLRVLVIDDHRDSAEGLAELLRLAGHEVELAYDGPSALDAVERSAPEVVISDLGLPEMDGFEIARTLRDRERSRELHLIALSGFGDSAAVERALEAGFDHHLTKPVDPRALRRLLDTPSQPMPRPV